MEYENESMEVETRFYELCSDANIYKPTMESAWKSFGDVKSKYTLEGDNLHWLVCSLYAACRHVGNKSLQSISGQTVKGNVISLSTLLGKAKFSFTDFLKKMTTWLEMNHDKLLQEHIKLLECNFRVCTVVFKKFCPIFVDVFKHCQPTVLEQSLKANQRPHRNHRKITCSPDDVFRFCWMLFIHAKGTDCSSIGGEVVSSFQLLICAMNICFKNSLICLHRKALLNPNFPGLPKNWDDSEYCPLYEDIPDIIELLIQRHCQMSKDEEEEFVLQTQVLSTHMWRKYISNLTMLEIYGEPGLLFKPEYFESNSKRLNKLYEEYIFTEGDFDERIFLQDDADDQLGTPIKSALPTANGSSGYPVEENSTSEMGSRIARTPLTNREYLIGKDRLGGGDVTRNPGMTSSIRSSDLQRLRKMLVGSKTTPSTTLLEIFNSCTEDIETQTRERLAVLSDQFLQAYASEDQDNSSGLADQRLIFTKMLYYNILEKIALQERKRLTGRHDLTHLLKRDDFNNLLFTCCLEITLCSMDAHRMFPWVLDALGIPSYYFYKIIELVIRAEESLTASVIKHLISVEEQILEQLAWKSDSPLWEAMEALPSDKAYSCLEVVSMFSDDVIASIACFAQVNFSYNIESSSSNSFLTSSSPKDVGSSHMVSSGSSNLSISHPRIKAVLGNEMAIRKPGSLRPIFETTSSSSDLLESGLAQDRFCSPSAGTAKRRLAFNGASSSTSEPAEAPVIKLITTSTSSPMTPITKDTALKNGKTFVINNSIAGPKCTNITVVSSLPSKPTSAITLATNSLTSATDSIKPKKTGSLALFWRKIYHLACVRLRHLCEQLSINSELSQKMWTCFEHSLSMNKAQLMKDRHIDQLLMCAVYVIAKISRQEQSFQEIMRCYRNQPQATSHVYRSVLIHPSPDKGQGADEREDLIQFYNKVYVPLLRDYVKQFSATSDTNKLEVPCSPMPRQRPVPQSPRRVTSNHNVYVSPMKSRPCVSPSSKHLEYNFQRSPSKHLRQINQMLEASKKPEGRPMNGKRSLPFTNGSSDCDDFKKIRLSGQNRHFYNESSMC